MRDNLKKIIGDKVDSNLIFFNKLSIEDLNLIESLTFINSIRNVYAEEYLHSSKTFSINETIKWFFSTNPEYYLLKYDVIPIGYFRTSNYSIENKSMYIGADIHPDFCNLKISYDAYIKFITFLFETKNLNKISLEVLATNNKAHNLYKKLGFFQEGIKRQEILKKSGFVDSILMSILKSEWKRDQKNE